MKKTHFTRKNYILLSLIFFLMVMVLFAGLCIDSNGGIFKTGNPVQKVGLAFGFPAIDASTQAYILLVLFCIYGVIFASALMFEMRIAKYYENRIWTKKYALIYLVTFVICLVLFAGIGIAAQYPYDLNNILNSFLYVLESFVLGFLVFVLLGSLILATCSLFVNFINIDKPFRFFSNKAEEEEERQEKRDKEEIKRLKEQGDLASSFGELNSDKKSLVTAVASSLNVSGKDNKDDGIIKDKERVFPGLSTIDYNLESKKEDKFDDGYSLKEICVRFRNYLANKEKLYFDQKTINAFISGMSASRLIILEGLSGTGKSSLARYFSEFINEKSYFEQVQATWRDRTALLGYYNDFSKTYNETEFLKRLYTETYFLNHINIMVLDEINISRVEYYFADFLSIMEYPLSDWKLKIMQLPYDFDAPKNLPDGVLQIPSNTWFIGTANKDDSTYTITDKVYDRAITISFDDRNVPFEVNADESGSITLSYNRLLSLFKEAQDNSSFNLSKEDLDKLFVLTDFTYNTFDITFGNRIMNQIMLFTPVFVSTGGTKEDALDFIFARKVIAKLEGRFEDYIKQGLLDLKSLIEKTYGKDSFNETNHIIDKLLRKL